MAHGAYWVSKPELLTLFNDLLIARGKEIITSCPIKTENAGISNYDEDLTISFHDKDNSENEIHLRVDRTQPNQARALKELASYNAGGIVAFFDAHHDRSEAFLNELYKPAPRNR